MLSLRPVVFIGLISYSLYLWHWPLIVFQRMNVLFPSDFSDVETKLALIAVSVGAACLSWKLVETPFRSQARKASKAVVFGGASAAMASAVALYGLVVVVGGAPFRFPDRVVAIAAYLGTILPRRSGPDTVICRETASSSTFRPA